MCGNKIKFQGESKKKKDRKRERMREIAMYAFLQTMIYDIFRLLGEQTH